jgi:hypothetical protein
VKPSGVDDQDAVGRGRHDPGSTEVAECARHDLSDGPDGIGELLLRYLRHQAALGTLLSGREIEEVRGDRCFTVPKALIAVC